jgi:twitching motility protein PilT
MSDTLLINNILNIASERKATDVHLVAGNNPVIRVDGRLLTLTEEVVLTPTSLNNIAETVLSKADIERLNQEREISTIYSWINRARFRIKVFYQKGYIAISMRLVPAYIRSPKDLGIPLAITQLLNRDKGLIFITGPFGSGRTTTAASLIETINQNKGLHIQTLEQPIEYLFSNNQSVIEQREVGKDVPDFSQGIKDVMDEDVDVVYVSLLHEFDLEERILELAESGKLVIVVMDADSVISAIERFLSDLSSEKRDWARNLLADVLIGGTAQRLLPRIGGGFALVSEVLTSTPAVRSSIKENKLHQLSSIMQTSKDEGMIDLDKALLSLVRSGEVSPEDAMSQALDPDIFKQNFS